MVRRPGRARRSSLRRRVYRARAKYDWHVTPRRFKTQPDRDDNLDWWLRNLDEIEVLVLEILENFGIPTDPNDDPNNYYPTTLKGFYWAFAKRVEERYLKFEYETYLKEKASLVYEFTERGLNAEVMAQVQAVIEGLGIRKKGLLVPPAWNYDDVIGNIWSQVYGAYDKRSPGSIFLKEPEGAHGGYYDNRE